MTPKEAEDAACRGLAAIRESASKAVTAFQNFGAAVGRLVVAVKEIKRGS